MNKITENKVIFKRKEHRFHLTPQFSWLDLQQQFLPSCCPISKFLLGTTLLLVILNSPCHNPFLPY